MDIHEKVFRTFFFDRPRAHRLLFAHRHPQASPDFHDDMIRAWHSRKRYQLFMVFRGGGKSTIAEEAITLQCGFREFKNYLIIGSSEDRAAERLGAIKREIEHNDDFREIFGDLVGPVWGDAEIILSNGAKLQARGRGQSLRGIKHNDMRPDGCLLDDVEETFKDVDTPEKRGKISRWYMSDLEPALDPSYRMRMNATPLDPESLPEENAKSPEWQPVHRYPVYRLDADARKIATWPERFPMRYMRGQKKEKHREIHAVEAEFLRKGMARHFNAEYLCKAEVMEEKPFRREYFNTEFVERTWQSVYAMFDPARTVGSDSATTGWAVWSWIQDRLVVWDAGAEKLLPDQIIAKVFEVAQDWEPVYIGVEEDGLNQWLLQPLRQEQLKRGAVIPFKPMRAPRGKMDFIRGLQPFFKAGEVQFAKQLVDLEQQLLSFPTGRIDCPNALAYALTMRPGVPLYPDFSGRHVAAEIEVSGSRPAHLALNATGATTTGILLQFVDGTIRILADYVREGEPGVVLRDIIAEAQVVATKVVKLSAGPVHFDRHLNVGLVQSAKKLPMEIQRGVSPDRGRAFLTNLLQREQRGFPMIRVAHSARWTLNGFASGYVKLTDKKGGVSESAEDGVYKLLMEGLESFAGLLSVGSTDEDSNGRNNAYTSAGVAYHSAMPRRNDRGR